jgi:hypothetical protein
MRPPNTPAPLRFCFFQMVARAYMHFLCPTTQYVVKRNGRQEEMLLDKITSRIKKLCYGLDKHYVDPTAITLKVSKLPRRVPRILWREDRCLFHQGKPHRAIALWISSVPKFNDICPCVLYSILCLCAHYLFANDFKLLPFCYALLPLVLTFLTLLVHSSSLQRAIIDIGCTRSLSRYQHDGAGRIVGTDW